MSDPLPEFIEVDRFAAKGGRLEGGYTVAALKRLEQMVAEPAGDIRFALNFRRDDEGRSRISGEIQGEVVLTCQRCLRRYRQALAGTVDLTALADERRLTDIPGDSEPLLTDGQPVRLADLVEDEAILALPIVALHPQCSPPEHDRSGGSEESPFAVLKRNR
ncbi:MAG: YceD family protein [Pseudomonadota bacterium]|nr:YceD family protein [Pseudomonadota bacterium]